MFQDRSETKTAAAPLDTGHLTNWKTCKREDTKSEKPASSRNTTEAHSSLCCEK